MRTVHKETKECEDKTEIHEFLSKSLLIIVECPECGKTMTKKSLKRHKERAHLKKEEKEKICLLMTVECPECGKTVTKKNLKRHKETAHLKLKRIGQCKECGKYFGRDSIKRHMRRVHKETKEYEDKKMLDLF